MDAATSSIYNVKGFEKFEKIKTRERGRKGECNNIKYGLVDNERKRLDTKQAVC